MKLVWSMVWLIVISGTAWAEDLSLPRISHTFPPPDDRRAPDRAIPDAHTGRVSQLTFSPDGRLLATAGDDKLVKIRDARTGEQFTGDVLHVLEGHTAPIQAIGFKPDGKSLISVANGDVIVWEVATGKLIERFPCSTAPDDCIVVGPTAEPLLARANHHKAVIWNYQTGKVVKEQKIDADVFSLACSSDGSTVLAATDKGVAPLFDDSHKLVGMQNSAAAKSVAQSADFAAMGEADGTLTIWRLPNHLPLPPILAHQGAINAVAIRADQVATAGDDKLVKVWDIATGQLLCTQVGHHDRVASVAFSSNGQKMASGGADGSVFYWTVPLPPIPPDNLEKIAAALPEKATVAPKQPRKLLVFWRADAILHKGGVPAANKAIELLGQKTGAFAADFTRDYEALDPKVLADYDALVMNSTAHLAIPDAAKQSLVDFAKGGKGIIGIHAAIDTFKSWPEGAEIIGATFGGHPWIPSGTWAVKLDEPDHPLLRAWHGQNFKMHDEFYELAEPYRRSDRRVLMSLDTSDPATAGVMPLHRKDNDFAVSWIKRYGNGRVFYCMFGHIGQPFQNPAVLQYYLDGNQYALGDLAVDDSPKAAP